MKYLFFILPLCLLALCVFASPNEQRPTMPSPCQPTATLANQDFWRTFWEVLLNTPGSAKTITLNTCAFAALQTGEVPPTLSVDDQLHLGGANLPLAIRTILTDHLFALVNTSCRHGFPHLLIAYQDWQSGSGYYFGQPWSTANLSSHATVACSS